MTYDVITADTLHGIAAGLAAKAGARRVNGHEQTVDVRAQAVTQAFVVIPVDDLKRRPPLPPSFWWDDYMPAGEVTLLGAHGGTGKSFIALMLAVSVALGLPLFGIPTRRGNVVFYSAEDGAEVLRHRLAWVCRVLSVDPEDLADRLHVLDATIGDPTLFHEVTADGRRMGTTTPTYAELHTYIERHQVSVAIIDNASDTFDANEVERARVRAFMRSLVRIARATGGAVLLLAHVDKATARKTPSGNENYSGSTAWHNSARSRLYLARESDGALLLEHQKATHGPMRQPLRLTWPKDGLPTVDEPLSGIVQNIADRNQTATLLKLIAEFTERGEFVSAATTSRSHAGVLLRRESGFPARLPNAELFDLLRHAERRGLLARTTMRSKGRGHSKEIWQVTPAGRNAAGLAPTAPTAPTTEVGAGGAEAAPTAPTPARGVRGEWGGCEVGDGETPVRPAGTGPEAWAAAACELHSRRDDT